MTEVAECPHSPDLEPAWCSKCLAATRPPEPAPLTDDSVGPAVKARYSGECPGCGMPIYVGAMVRPRSHRWYHEGCE